MKIINVYILCFALLAFVIQSCSEMNDLGDQFLDEGEITYAAKVDSVISNPGKGRLQLEIRILSQRIETVRIYWNDYTDSSDVQVENQTGIFKKIFENMEEKEYIFELVSIDKYGNRSLPVEATGIVYGDMYESILSTRACKIVSSNAGLVLRFSAPDEGNVATTVTYTNTSGVLTSVDIPAIDNSYIIEDYDSQSQIVLQSSYRPVNGIDLFYSTPSYLGSGFFSFDKNEWVIINYSDQYSAGENGVNNIIDGTDGTRWHTNGSSYPHYATIDMGAVRTIAQIGVWRTTFDGGGDDRAPNRIQFLISMDNSTWTDLGEFDFNNLMNGEQVYAMSGLPQGRYLKFVGLAGNNKYMTLGEISIYGF